MCNFHIHAHIFRCWIWFCSSRDGAAASAGHTRYILHCFCLCLPVLYCWRVLLIFSSNSQTSQTSQKCCRQFALKHTVWVFFVSTCWSRRWGRSSFLPFSCLHGHTPNEGVVHTHQDVLWLDVRVDDFTFSVEVVQTLQDLQTHSDKQTDFITEKHAHTRCLGT